MTDITPNLQLPYILASQAQKHITHNEALRQLDGLIALTIVDTLSAPPPAPQEGQSYLVDASATGDWASKDGLIANYVDGAWQYLTPRTGWAAWFSTEGQTLVFDGASWINPLSSGNLEMLGINASPDVTNRLALSSPASLFNNAGNGHQIKINKASAADTASVVFQTSWSGRAEMGTAGSDDFLFKVSPDGAGWKDALQINTSGIVSTPQRPIASASLNVGTMTLASGSQSGFDTLDINQGGVSLGSSLPSGNGSELVVPATGLYQLCFAAKVKPAAAFSMQLLANGSATLATISSDMAESGFISHSTSAIASLSAGDALCFEHTGSADIATGAANTWLTLMLL